MTFVDELIDIVDEENNVIGTARFSEAHSKGLWHRSVHVFVFDSNFNLLVCQRARGLRTDSLLFSSSAAGHVKHAQRPEETALEELQEELFFQKPLSEEILLKPVLTFKRCFPERLWDKEFIALFEWDVASVTPSIFSPNPSEVNSIRWVPFQQLVKEINDSPEVYARTFTELVKMYRQSHNKL